MQDAPRIFRLESHLLQLSMSHDPSQSLLRESESVLFSLLRSHSSTRSANLSLPGRSPLYWKSRPFSIQKTQCHRQSCSVPEVSSGMDIPVLPDQTSCSDSSRPVLHTWQVQSCIRDSRPPVQSQSHHKQ